MLLNITTMATNFSPCKGSYVLEQFPSIVMFGMKGFHVSASGAIQGHHGRLLFVAFPNNFEKDHPRNIPAKLFQNLTSGLREKGFF